MRINVLEYLEESAERYPEKTAFADPQETLTFSQLLDGARAIGTALVRQVPDRRRPVAVLAERGVSGPLAFMGALAAGCCYAPLDGEMPEARLTAILEQLDPPVILYGPGQEKTAGKLAGRYSVASIAALAGGPVDVELLARRRAEVLDTDPIYMIFTSGSTGVPKGIVCHHRGVIDFAEWLAEASGCTASDVLANQAPFYFDLSVKDLTMTLKCGATCHILPKKLFMFPKLLMEQLNQVQATVLYWATSAFHLVAGSGVLEVCPPKSVTRVLVGGEAMLARDLNAWRRALPETTFINMYGPTEVTVDATWYRVDRPYEDWEAIPIGRPCANKEVLLLDQALRPVLDGQVGEICVRGSGLAHGYYKDPEKTTAAFLQNPLIDAYPDRIYRTGDLACRNGEGLLVFQSRKDGQIKHMGYRIELGEVERALAACPLIREAVCFYDQERGRIVCCYAGDGDSSALAGVLRRQLPKYMLPNVYLAMDNLPRNANGKVDRPRLRRDYQIRQDAGEKEGQAHGRA